MKHLALGLLLLVGCAGKPKDNTSAQRALQTLTQPQINAHNKSVGEVGMSQGDGRGMEPQPDIRDNTIQPCEKGTHWELDWDQYGAYWGCAKNTSQDDNYMIRFPESLPEAALTSAEQLLVCVRGLCNWESYCGHAKKGQECVQRRKP